MVLKRHLTPLTKKGSITKHKGKGGTPQGAPLPAAFGGMARSVNDFSKASPMPSPGALPGPSAPLATDQDFS